MSLDSKDWRNAVIAGSLIGGAMLIGIVVTKGPKTANQPVTSNSNSNSNSNSSASSSPSSSITQQEAGNLISNWLQSKRQIFASPFNRQLAAEFTTDVLYQDMTKPGGSIDWLIENQAYYQFGVQKIESIKQFSANGTQATIEVNLTEDRTFYVNGKVDLTQTDFNTKLVRYNLQFVDGRWKISDYRSIN
ncbi:ARC6/PARC6 family protein [Tychonema sp. LEGE 07203]|uniref:ARC6/PARC6 family protein n=1 Tax=Tychonema sp. LEGE 07203 TaxID=1828671 RepID=UPI0018825963|nr:ARC6/PARC6 family protein [Tychonema sp. LEGE 07203]MBE9093330.1 ARC6/PARC6 family protein [Tychonema sp. LEGE 07203]